MAVILILAVESAGGPPVVLGKTDARDLLLTTARRLITESRDRIQPMASEDPVLGELQLRETCYIEQVLDLVLPELRPVSVC